MGNLNYATLGSARIAVMMADADNPEFRDRLSDTLAPDMPDRSQITGRAGVVYFNPRQSYIPNENDNNGAIGDKADTPMMESAIEGRNYFARRYAVGECYPVGLEGDVVFDHTKANLVPKTRNQVTLNIDTIVRDIISGNGVDTAESSRAITNVDLTGVEWDTPAGDPLQVLKDAVKQVGSGARTEVYFSDDVADALQKNGSIVQSIKGTDTSLAQVSRPELVEFLEGYLSVGRVTIGMRQYQNGASTQDLDLRFLTSGVAYVGVMGNLTKIPWKPLVGDEFRDPSKDVEAVRATEWCDIISLDVSLSIAHTNVLSA